MGMKIYVQAKSKKAVNEKLAAGENVTGFNYSIFGGGGYYDLKDCESGTVVAIYEKESGGSPVAKAWGTWDKVKGRLK